MPRLWRARKKPAEWVATFAEDGVRLQATRR
jgi:hypothetical protein